MNFDDIDLDKQHQYITEFKTDPIEVGRLCEKFPALKNTWQQFLTVLEMCKEDDKSIY